MKEYFAHDYNASENLLKLKIKFKHEGLGVYWELVEYLHRNPQKQMLDDIENLAFLFHADAEILRKIITDFGLFCFDEKFFWNERVLRNLNKRLSISEARKKAGRLGGLRGGRPKKCLMKEERKNSIYLIKMRKENEEFLKVGITGERLTRRFSGSPYEWEVIFEEFCDVKDGAIIEEAISDEFNKYTPLLEFGGKTECYLLNDEKQILSKIKAKFSKGKEKKGKEKKEIKETGLSSFLNSSFFEEFWDLYPKKTAKAVALKKWREVVDDEESILLKFKEALLWQKTDPSCFGTEPQYQPKPQDYIEGERWNDVKPKQEMPYQIKTFKSLNCTS